MDTTVPAGAVCASYQVAATRGAKTSGWSPMFGVRYTPESGSQDAGDEDAGGHDAGIGGVMIDAARRRRPLE